MPTLTDAQTEQSLDTAFYLRIHGIGWPTAGWTTRSSAGRDLLIFTRLPDWTPSASQRFITGLSVPESWSQDVSPYGGIAEGKALSFMLQDFQDSQDADNWFWGQAFASEVFQGESPGGNHSRLRAALTPTATTVLLENVDDFLSCGGLVFAGNETLLYTAAASDAPGGGPRLTGLSRDRHPAIGSSAGRHHRVDTDVEGNFIDVQPLITTRPRTWFNRLVVLRATNRLPSGAWETEANAATLWSGWIRRIHWVPSKHSFRLTCDALLSALDREIFTRRPVRTRIVGCSIGSRLVDRQFTVENTSYTLGTSTFWSPDDLVHEMNEIEGRNSFRIAEANDSYGIEERHAWSVRDAQIPAGIALALGFPPAPQTLLHMITGPSVTNPSPYPVPVASYYETPASEAAVLRVANADGFLTNQQATGSGRGWVLIDKRALFGVGTVVTGALPERLEGDTISPQSYIGLYRPALAVVVPLPSNTEEALMLDGAHVEQVFAPGVSGQYGDLRILTQMRRIIASTGSGAGEPDIFAADLGLSLSADLLNLQSFIDVENELGTGVTFGWPSMFDTTMKFREWADPICRALGVAIVMQGGQLTARRLRALPVADGTEIAIAATDIVPKNARPDYESGAGTVINVVKLHWNKPLWADQFLSNALAITFADSLAQHGVGKTLDLELPSLLGEGGDIGPIASRLADWLASFTQPRPIISVRLARRWWRRLVPMDVVSLTEPSIHDVVTGAYGVTARLALVLGVDEDFHGGAAVRLMLLPYQQQAPLAPSGLADFARGDGGFDAATNRLYLRDSEFSPTGTLDASAFSNADAVLICEDATATTATPQLWRRTVNGAPNLTPGASYLPLSSALAGWVSTRRYFVTFDHYSATVAGQRTRGSFIANDDVRLNGTSRTYPWT